MILNVSGRTDIVQYFHEWLIKRFEEQYVLVRNPIYPDKIMRYEISPDKVDCVAFCSKDYSKILPRFEEITKNFNVYCYYTITGYGRDVEPRVPTIVNSIKTLIALSSLVGKNRVAWRYDPILFTEKYTIKHHIEMFELLMSALHPYIDRCVFSFVEMYKKLQRNMPEIIPMTDEDKDLIAKNIGEIARKYDITVQTCGNNGDYSKYGIHSSGCMTLNILGKANNIQFKKMKHKGSREGCHCVTTCDIGAYDTCLNGCKYCYANNDMTKVIENFQMHDPNSPLLVGEPSLHDIIMQGKQVSFLK